MKKHPFKVYVLDVWGNAEEGYDVNDKMEIGEIELSEEADKEEILQVLFDGGFIIDPKTTDTSGIDIIDSYPDWGIDENGKPLFQLEVIEE